MKEKTRKTTITPKEKKIIELIALGYTDREIAAHLNSTYSSIRSIFGNLLIKTGTVNRPHLVSWAYKEKMFDNSESRVALTDIRTGERDIRVEQDKRLTKENNCYRKALEEIEAEAMSIKHFNFGYDELEIGNDIVEYANTILDIIADLRTDETKCNPDSEQIEPTGATLHRRNSVSVEQIQDSKAKGANNAN